MNQNISIGTLMRRLSFLVSVVVVVAARVVDAAWLKNVLFFVGLSGIAVTAVKEYLSFKADQKRAAEAKQVREVADSAHRTATSAILGRRLSDEQKAAITANVAGLNFAELKVMISYIPNATEAQDFADSLTRFLSTFRVECNGPVEDKLAGPPPRLPIIGTTFFVAASAPGKAGVMADAFASAVPEIRRSGENSAWPFPTNMFQIRVIVGQKM